MALPSHLGTARPEGPKSRNGRTRPWSTERADRERRKVRADRQTPSCRPRAARRLQRRLVPNGRPRRRRRHRVPGAAVPRVRGSRGRPGDHRALGRGARDGRVCAAGHLADAVRGPRVCNGGDGCGGGRPPGGRRSRAICGPGRRFGAGRWRCVPGGVRAPTRVPRRPPVAPDPHRLHGRRRPGHDRLPGGHDRGRVPVRVRLAGQARRAGRAPRGGPARGA